LPEIKQSGDESRLDGGKMAFATHEPHSRAYEVKAGSDRNFGLVVGGVLVMIAAYRLYVGGSTTLVTIVALLGIALIAAALTAPAMLAPANRLWFRLGMLLHKVTNPILLGAIFAIAFVPTGVLMRALGRDPLRLKPEPDAPTYWIPRHKSGSTPESLRQPF
jgi:hypothetical protein